MKTCTKMRYTASASAIALITVVPLALCAAAPAAARAPGGRRTVRVSVGAGGSQANAGSSELSISGNGRYLAFTSDASNLVANDTNGTADVFVADPKSLVTSRVSVTSGGGQVTGSMAEPAISDNGRYVAFESDSPDLVPGDTNGVLDVFVRDRRMGTTRRVSVGAAGAQANGLSATPSLSADGRYVAFTSWADNLVGGDTNLASDIFVRDLRRGTTRRVSLGATGEQGDAGRPSLDAEISAGGHQVVFTSFATNLVAGDTNFTSDVFVRDLRAGTTVRASVGPTNEQTSGGIKGFGNVRPSISADGRVVAFDSYANGLADELTRNFGDPYTRDLVTGRTQRVALGAGRVVGVHTGAGTPEVAANGRYIVFESVADNLVAGDTNAAADVFVRDLRDQVTTRVSIGANGQASAGSGAGVISGNGRHVGFVSAADNLVPGDTNDVLDVFHR